MANFGSDTYLMPPLTLADAATYDTDEARQMRYATFLEFYNGAQWMEKRRPGERRLTVNYGRTFIHKGASYLMGKPVSVELIPNAEGKRAEKLAADTEAALRKMWDFNNLPLLDYDTAVDAAILGDAAFKVTRQSKKPQSPLHLAVGDGLYQVVVRSVDVCNLKAGWAGDDLNSLLWVEEKYRLLAGQVRSRYGRAALPLITITDDAPVTVCEHWDEEYYTVSVEGQTVLDTANPYGFIPYVIFPNLARPRQFWGLSDLEDIMTLNSEFNVRVSILSQLLQMSGNPVLVLENVESAEGMRVGPGAIWTLPEGAKASLLELLKEGGVGLHVQYIELLYKMMHDLSELPPGGFGRDTSSSQASSGVAIEQLLFPVVQRVNRKRRIWDEALDLRNRMMLALTGLPIHRSKIVWPDVLPKDRAGLVTQEVGLVASSIHSLDTARRNLGDEQPDFENEQIIKERAELLVAQNAAGGAGPGAGNGPAGQIKPPTTKLSGALVQGLSNSGG
jgi:hypothetical protein